uniref:Uncharacterized protein n=2 Tax=Triticum urartu TaxID=4572 RepID=A0A8R7PFA8_TRIUA
GEPSDAARFLCTFLSSLASRDLSDGVYPRSARRRNAIRVPEASRHLPPVCLTLCRDSRWRRECSIGCIPRRSLQRQRRGAHYVSTSFLSWIQCLLCLSEPRSGRGLYWEDCDNTETINDSEFLLTPVCHT